MTDQTAWLKNELERVKKALDLKNEETQLLYLENKKLIEVEQSHQKLVGELYRKIDDLTKESKEMLNYP
jgi:regulator of replication initiation timing|tara:strand:- start:43 stop:249 length:207 start_codon:yes stop_codon:yes gene_type:complete